MTTEKQDTTVPPLPWIEVCESGYWWINTDNDEAFDGGWVCDSDPGVFRNQATIEFMLRTVNAYPHLVAALSDAARELSMANHYWEGSPSYTARVKKAEQIINTALAAAQEPTQ